MAPAEAPPAPAPAPEPPAAPQPRPAGLKQLFTGACLLWVAILFLGFGANAVVAFLFLLAFLSSLAGLLKARRFRFRLYGVLLTLEAALPFAAFVAHYWHSR